MKKNLLVGLQELPRRPAAGREYGKNGAADLVRPAGDALHGRHVVSEVVDDDGDAREARLPPGFGGHRGGGEAGTRRRSRRGDEGGTRRRRGGTSLDVEGDSQREGEEDEEEGDRRDPETRPLQAARRAGPDPRATSSPRSRIASLPPVSPGKTMTLSSGVRPLPARVTPDGET